MERMKSFLCPVLVNLLMLWAFITLMIWLRGLGSPQFNDYSSSAISYRFGLPAGGFVGGIIADLFAYFLAQVRASTNLGQLCGPRLGQG